MQEEMILRDYLAADRTALANERTLMSYLRTALAFIVSGGSAVHFVGGRAIETVGVLLIIAGVVIFGFGIQRFLTYRRRINSVTSEASLPPRPS